MGGRLLNIIFILCAAVSVVHGQIVLKDTTDLSDYSIEDLSKMKSRYKATDMEKAISRAIQAASRAPLPLRKAPSIISVITGEEIEKSGARDLMGVLSMVPGIEFNVDVEGVVAISFRGLWSNEGNISLQIDGQEVNEIAYASLQFGNHYAVSQIKKIEIIRGPGSAIYGGCAEYAVINVITLQGEDIKGVRAEVLASEAAETFSRRKLALSVGNKTKDFSYALSGMVARGRRSNATYTDVYGQSYAMAENADLNNDHINMSMAYKGLSARFIYDNYQTTNRDGDLHAMSQAYALGFLSAMSEIKYVHNWNKKLHTVFRLAHKYSEPWSFRGTAQLVDSAYGTYVMRANTLRANVGLLWDPFRQLNVSCGMEGYNDNGLLVGENLYRTDSTNRVSYMNYAPYAQLLFKSIFANVTIGARYDISTAFGSAFNPRVGLTKKLGIFNFKLLYASSFRAPAIESIQYGIDNRKLKPERSNTLEFEASVKIRKDMYLSLNAFDINTRNAIRYFVKTDTVIMGFPDGYRNSDIMTGSQGIELEYKYKSSFGSVNVAYSFYTVHNKGVDEANRVPGNTSVTLGTAPNKCSISGTLNITDKIYLSPAINFLDRRYGYSSVDAAEKGILTRYTPQTLIGLFAGSTDLIRNVALGIGVRNLTNEKIIYPQAYNSLHAPLPGMGRELYIRVNYRLKFKQKEN